MDRVIQRIRDDIAKRQPRQIGRYVGRVHPHARLERERLERDLEKLERVESGDLIEMAK